MPKRKGSDQLPLEAEEIIFIMATACSPATPLSQQLPTSLPTASLMPTESPAPTDLCSNEAG
ncbi:MAG: hypothetical protein U0X87_03800 [Anaerolineales bacterium]